MLEDMIDCYLNTVYWGLPPCDVTYEYPTQGFAYLNKYTGTYINEETYYSLPEKEQKIII